MTAVSGNPKPEGRNPKEARRPKSEMVAGWVRASSFSGAGTGIFWRQHRRADIPVRSKLRKATRTGQFVSHISHRTLLRTGMSARRLGGSASICGAGSVRLRRAGAFSVRGHEGAAGFGFRNSDLIRASDFGLRVWQQTSTEVAKETLS